MYEIVKERNFHRINHGLTAKEHVVELITIGTFLLVKCRVKDFGGLDAI